MAISKIGKRRLKKLIRFMRGLPKKANEHFYMGTWFNHEGPHKLKGKYVTEKILQDCGTTACALGWACTIPEFKKAGLRMPIDDTDYPYLKSHKFFGISEDMASRLFTAPVLTPKAWANYAERSMKRQTAK